MKILSDPQSLIVDTLGPTFCPVHSIPCDSNNLERQTMSQTVTKSCCSRVEEDESVCCFLLDNIFTSS